MVLDGNASKPKTRQSGANTKTILLIETPLAIEPGKRLEPNMRFQNAPDTFAPPWRDKTGTYSVYATVCTTLSPDQTETSEIPAPSV
jgi:hypothetical protein